MGIDFKRTVSALELSGGANSTGGPVKSPYIDVMAKLQCGTKFARQKARIKIVNVYA